MSRNDVSCQSVFILVMIITFPSYHTLARALHQQSPSLQARNTFTHPLSLCYLVVFPVSVFHPATFTLHHQKPVISFQVPPSAVLEGSRAFGAFIPYLVVLELSFSHGKQHHCSIFVPHGLFSFIMGLSLAQAEACLSSDPHHNSIFSSHDVLSGLMA